MRVAQRPESIVVLLSRRIPQPQVNRLPVDHYIGAEKHVSNTKIKSKQREAGQAQKHHINQQNQPHTHTDRQADKQTAQTNRQTCKLIDTCRRERDRKDD